ncbi:hypothetical protein QFC22_003206 [Naganishia vaughanmartiniae]|uniref:Uncharacterized protein n=1 Tax=Naganishia vaughanmartiniae TaxID=1424756 RepID=A0ACC2X630_9TREE|nr:hypothetical protein QFC22_003206 [Naganishia vaughanmartiniae]
MASLESEDEFGDGQSFEYNEAFESHLRIIESQQAAVPVLAVSPTTTSTYLTADRASATRRKLEHLDISLEAEATDSDLVDELVGAEDQELLDVLNISGSQASKYEEELVQQVTQLIPAAAGASNTQTPKNSEAAQTGNAQEIVLDPIIEGEEPGTRKRSLFQKFRKRGFFSVTDLVAPSWCEVQFDYRLRSKSYLPVAARPDTFQTSTGAVLVVNKEIAGTGEKIMRKGEQVHKKLEREIHPVEVEVKTDSREDVWGLRFLNMLASLEALMTLGKCRELPVVGFVKGYMLVGVIDEITRKPLVTYNKNKSLLFSSQALTDCPTVLQNPPSHEKKAGPAKSDKIALKRTDNGKKSDGPRSSPQKTLFAFYRPLRARPALPRISHDRTHVLYVSDSKTRAGGTMPKEENSNNGKMQLMLYKEMLDGMIVEGLRQHARERKSQQSAESDSTDKVQVAGEDLDEDVICIDSDGNEMAPSAPTELPSPRKEANTTGEYSASTGSAIDPFTWPELFDHLALDATQPFTETFLAQSRPLIEGNSLTASVAAARNLQQMTSCWAEYVSKLGLGTIDPTLDDAGLEAALNTETGGRKIGRSEKLLSLVYRRVGKSAKKKVRQPRSGTADGPIKDGSKGKKRRRRGKDAQDGAQASPGLPTEGDDQDKAVAAGWQVSAPTQSLNAIEVEEERTLRLAIAESLGAAVVTATSYPGTSKGNQITPEDLADDDDEPLPQSLLPSGTFREIAEQRPSASAPPRHQVIQVAGPSPIVESEQATSNPTEGVDTPDTDGSIIGSHRFAYSSTLLAEHIDKVLQFWTGAREPTGVTIENTSRCGWCEFEDGCEWRGAKAQEAISKNEALKSSRRPTVS